MTEKPEARSHVSRPGLVRNWHWVTLSGFLIAFAGFAGFMQSLGSGGGEWAMLLMAVGIIMVILGLATKAYTVITARMH